MLRGVRRRGLPGAELPVGRGVVRLSFRRRRRARTSRLLEPGLLRHVDGLLYLRRVIRGLRVRARRVSDGRRAATERTSLDFATYVKRTTPEDGSTPQERAQRRCSYGRESTRVGRPAQVPDQFGDVPECSGHGRCMTMRDAGKSFDGFHLNRTSHLGGSHGVAYRLRRPTNFVGRAAARGDAAAANFADRSLIQRGDAAATTRTGSAETGAARPQVRPLGRGPHKRLRLRPGLPVVRLFALNLRRRRRSTDPRRPGRRGDALLQVRIAVQRHALVRVRRRVYPAGLRVGHHGVGVLREARRAPRSARRLDDNLPGADSSAGVRFSRRPTLFRRRHADDRRIFKRRRRRAASHGRLVRSQLEIGAGALRDESDVKLLLRQLRRVFFAMVRRPRDGLDIARRDRRASPSRLAEAPHAEQRRCPGLVRVGHTAWLVRGRQSGRVVYHASWESAAVSAHRFSFRKRRAGRVHPRVPPDGNEGTRDVQRRRLLRQGRQRHVEYGRNLSETDERHLRLRRGLRVRRGLWVLRPAPVQHVRVDRVPARGPGRNAFEKASSFARA